MSYIYLFRLNFVHKYKSRPLPTRPMSHPPPRSALCSCFIYVCPSALFACSGSIKDALIALYSSQRHLQEVGPMDPMLEKEFTTQIGLLQTRLKQIGGAQDFEAPVRLTNEQLAHELLLGPLYQTDVRAAAAFRKVGALLWLPPWQA